MTTFSRLRSLLTMAFAVPAALATVLVAAPAAPAKAAAPIDLHNCEGDKVDRCVGVRYDRDNRRFRPYLRITDMTVPYSYRVDATHLRFGFEGQWWGYGLPDGGELFSDIEDGPLRPCPADGSSIVLTVYGEFRWRHFDEPAASGGNHHWLFRICN
jgi:hypothetical protein